MVKFILKRIGTMIIAMFMIILITFTLMHSIPGGPFTNTKGVPEEVTQAMEAKYGLDQPMPVQFVKYLGSLLHGDFGPSYKYTGKTVNDFIATGAPVSAKLGLVTLVFVLLTSIPMGILAALKNGKWQDMLLMAIATIGVTIPSFVIASMLIYVFSFKLNVLPTFGLDSWKSYILPVIAMSFLPLCKTGDSSNNLFYSNADYDALVDQVKAENDPAKAAELTLQADAIVSNDYAVLPLYYKSNNYLMHDNISGFYMTASGNLFFKDVKVG